MPDAKQFFATNNYRTDDSGYSAFETLGRRVGGQYNQAGTDIADIGRAQAATINMLGRWPFNILDLEKRESLRFAKQNAPGRAPSGPMAGAVQGRGGGSSVTDEQFAPRREINLSSLNEISEGAGQFGRMVGGPSQLPYLAQQRGVLEAQRAREDARNRQAADAANQKEWDKYEKGLSDYNNALDKSTREWADKSSVDSNGPQQDLPYYDNTNAGVDIPYVDPLAPSTTPPSWYSPQGVWNSTAQDATSVGSSIVEGAQLYGSDLGLR